MHKGSVVSLNTYTFNLGQLLSRVEIRQEGIFSQRCRKNAPTLVERDTAAGKDWLDRMLRLKCRLVWGLVSHCAGQDTTDSMRKLRCWLVFLKKKKKILVCTGVLDKVNISAEAAAATSIDPRPPNHFHLMYLLSQQLYTTSSAISKPS